MKEYTDHTFAICAYKESPYLEECIISLRKQTVRCNYLMVTSTPNAYIENLAKKYQIPYFVNTGQGGITQDWNFAYAQTKTKYITIAHQDDIYEKDYLAAAIGLLEQAKKPLIFFSDYYEIRNGERTTKNRLLTIKRIMLLPLRIRRFWNVRWIRRRILSLGSPICCPSVTFAAENLPDVIFADGFRACEDWEAWEKLSRLKGAFVYSPELLMGHRIHEGSETSAIIKDRKRSEEEYQMYCKFWPEWIAGMIAKLYAKGQDSNRLK